MTHPTRIALAEAIADAQRGHRITEYERVADDLAAAALAYIKHVDEKRSETEFDDVEPKSPLERIVYWGQDEFEEAVLSSGAGDSVRRQQPKTLEDMQAEVTSWCERKGWKGEGSAPVTFGDTMALLHSEVSEALEAYRDWGLADATGANSPQAHLNGCDYRKAILASDGPKFHPCTCDVAARSKPEGIGSEFADVLIRLLDDCDRWGVDLRFEYERKMAFNEKRPYQHGGRIL
jgi:NTP pyrophosphatase (non-canonical NTP hydrolase)